MKIKCEHFKIFAMENNLGFVWSKGNDRIIPESKKIIKTKHNTSR